MKSIKILGKKLSQTRLGRQKDTSLVSSPAPTSTSEESEKRNYLEIFGRRVTASFSKHQPNEKLSPLVGEKPLFNHEGSMSPCSRTRPDVLAHQTPSTVKTPQLDGNDRPASFITSPASSASPDSSVSPESLSTGFIDTISVPSAWLNPRNNQIDPHRSVGKTESTVDVAEVADSQAAYGLGLFAETESFSSLDFTDISDTNVTDGMPPPKASTPPPGATQKALERDMMDRMSMIQREESIEDVSEEVMQPSDSIMTDLGVAFGSFPPPPIRNSSVCSTPSNIGLRFSEINGILALGNMSSYLVTSTDNSLASSPLTGNVNKVEATETCVGPSWQERAKFAAKIPLQQQADLLIKDKKLAEMSSLARRRKQKQQQNNVFKRDSNSWEESDQSLSLSDERVSKIEITRVDPPSHPVSDVKHGGVVRPPAASSKYGALARMDRRSPITPAERRFSSLVYLRDGQPVPARVPWTPRSPTEFPPSAAWERSSNASGGLTKQGWSHVAQTMETEGSFLSRTNSYDSVGQEDTKRRDGKPELEKGPWSSIVVGMQAQEFTPRVAKLTAFRRYLPTTPLIQLPRQVEEQFATLRLPRGEIQLQPKSDLCSHPSSMACQAGCGEPGSGLHPSNFIQLDTPPPTPKMSGFSSSTSDLHVVGMVGNGVGDAESRKIRKASSKSSLGKLASMRSLGHQKSSHSLRSEKENSEDDSISRTLASSQPPILGSEGDQPSPSAEPQVNVVEGRRKRSNTLRSVGKSIGRLRQLARSIRPNGGGGGGGGGGTLNSNETRPSLDDSEVWGPVTRHPSPELCTCAPQPDGAACLHAQATTAFALDELKKAMQTNLKGRNTLVTSDATQNEPLSAFGYFTPAASPRLPSHESKEPSSSSSSSTGRRPIHHPLSFHQHHHYQHPNLFRTDPSLAIGLAE